MVNEENAPTGLVNRDAEEINNPFAIILDAIASFFESFGINMPSSVLTELLGKEEPFNRAYEEGVKSIVSESGSVEKRILNNINANLENPFDHVLYADLDSNSHEVIANYERAKMGTQNVPGLGRDAFVDLLEQSITKQQELVAQTMPNLLRIVSGDKPNFEYLNNIDASKKIGIQFNVDDIPELYEVYHENGSLIKRLELIESGGKAVFKMKDKILEHTPEIPLLKDSPFKEQSKLISFETGLLIIGRDAKDHFEANTKDIYTNGTKMDFDQVMLRLQPSIKYAEQDLSGSKEYNENMDKIRDIISDRTLDGILTKKEMRELNISLQRMGVQFRLKNGEGNRVEDAFLSKKSMVVSDNGKPTELRESLKEFLDDSAALDLSNYKPPLPRTVELDKGV